MKIRCLYNTSEALKPYEYKILKTGMMGRFGVTNYSQFEELDIGKEYLVMGIIVFETYQGYLIDDGGLILVCPCQLFEIIDNKLSTNWRFRLVDNDENIYPYIQVIFGYPELCFDKKAYENLIVEKEESAQRTYFRRKIELEDELA